MDIYVHMDINEYMWVYMDIYIYFTSIFIFHIYYIYICLKMSLGF